MRQQAVSLNRKDIVFAAEAIAAEASIGDSKAAENQIKALPLILRAISDSGNAFKDVQSPPEPEALEPLLRRLVWLMDEASIFPFRLLRAQDQRDAALRQLAASVDKNIPVDFHFHPSFGDAARTVQIAETLANLSYAYGSSAVAGQRLSFAADLARDMGDPDAWASILSTRYDNERRMGASASRTRELRNEARRAAAALRTSYASRAGRIWATYRSDRLFGTMLKDQLNEPSEPPAAVFAAVEALKARTLLDELTFPRPAAVSSKQALDAERRAIGFDPLPDVMFEHNEALRSESSLVTQLSAFETFDTHTSDRLGAIDELESIYRNAGAGFTEAARPATLGDIQEALGPREAMLEYVIPFDVADPVPGLWILMISRNAFVVAKAPLDKVTFTGCESKSRMFAGGAALDQSPLGCGVINLRMAIQQSDDDFAKEVLRGFHFLLIEPLLAKGARLADFDHLIIVPHGALHYVPFAALRDENGDYLVSKTAITVAPSATIWRLLTTRQGEARSFAGFANPTLRYATVEVNAASDAARSAGLTASATSGGTKDRFLQAIASANVLHLATHGDAPRENAQESHALVLNGSKESKVTVRASEIEMLPLQKNRLTVLSVCDAGLYRTGPGNEPYGLMPAFLQAGSQNVMGTLWQLDDQFGNEFMVEFYRHLWSDGPAEAMRKTSLHFIGRHELIRNWAAFVLMGPGRSFTPLASK